MFIAGGGGNTGELGNNQQGTSYAYPVRVFAGAATGPDSSDKYLANVKEVSGGYQYSCALSNAGNVYCWGLATSGQLGDNQNSTNRVTPVRVLSGSAASADIVDSSYLGNIRQITAGYGHVCAISNSGNTYCWGLATSGQLGETGGVNQSRPIKVFSGAADGVDASGGFLINMKQISAGNDGFHTCAISNATSTYCWGLGTGGEMGDNGTTNRFTPVKVKAGAAEGADASGGNLVNLKQISAGEEHTCAISNATSTYCWGLGAGGAIGDNGTTNRLTPVKVKAGAAEGVDASGGNLVNIKQIATGLRYTCAISNATSTYCWGQAADGRLGDNQNSTNRLTPVKVKAGSADNIDSNNGNIIGLKQIATGGNAGHTCAIANSGNTYCWGEHVFSALGDGQNTTERKTPIRPWHGDTTYPKVKLTGSGYLGGDTNWQIFHLEIAGHSTTTGSGILYASSTSILSGSTLSGSSKTIAVVGPKFIYPFESQGTFDYSSSTISFQTTASSTLIEPFTYYHLEFAPPSDSALFRMSTTTATTTVLGNFTLGGSGAAYYDADTLDLPLEVRGNLTIGSGDIFRAPTTTNLWIGGNFTNNGTFTHNNGTTTFFLNPALDASTISGSTTFYSIFANAPRKVIKFTNGTTYSVAGNFDVNGEPGRPIDLFSSTDGSQWTILFYNAQSGVSWVRIKDSGCNGGSASVSLPNSAVDNGNNGACWIFSRITFGGHGGGGSPQGTDGGSGGGTQYSGGGTGSGSGGTEGGSGGGGQQTGGGTGGGGGASP